jgi:hypothetical protein
VSSINDHAELKARFFPGLEPWEIMLIERPGGWWAELNLRYGRRGGWRCLTITARAGGDGYSGLKDQLYKKPESALKALQAQVQELPAIAYDATGGGELIQ